MASYQKKFNTRSTGSCFVPSNKVRFSSKTDAFLDGVSSLLEILPDPRARLIRAYVYHYAPHARSVNEAMWADWAAIGQDMGKAIEAHAPVLPVAIEGTRACMPKGSRWPAEARGRVRVLEPISTAGLGPADVARIRDLARARIAAAAGNR